MARNKFERIKNIIEFEANNNMPCHSKYNYDEEINHDIYRRLMVNVLDTIKRIEYDDCIGTLPKIM